MATENPTTDQRLSETEIEQIRYLLNEIATASNTVGSMMKAGVDVVDTAELLYCLEPSVCKIGWMADKALSFFFGGKPQIAGEANEWFLGDSFSRIAEAGHE